LLGVAEYNMCQNGTLANKTVIKAI